jgi:D-xylose 1-dehydrogenase
MSALYSDLADKTVIVTGGASGIGEAIVRGFVEQGARVGYIDIDAKAAEVLTATLSAQGTVAHVVADLTDTAALRAAIATLREKLGSIDVLVNNAAHDERHSFDSITPEYFDQRIAVNLKHMVFASQAVLPDMVAKKKGAIVNFSSTSWMIGQGNMAIYTAAKSATLGLTRSIARDYGPHGVRANTVAPGWIRTERQVKFWITPEGEKGLMDRQCLKRWLAPEEMASITLFLASDASSACTAQLFIADGGSV